VDVKHPVAVTGVQFRPRDFKFDSKQVLRVRRVTILAEQYVVGVDPTVCGCKAFVVIVERRSSVVVDDVRVGELWFSFLLFFQRATTLLEASAAMFRAGCTRPPLNPSVFSRKSS
jgi:hypothetical protein